VDVEDKYSVGWYMRGNPFVPVSQMRPNANSPMAADAHTLDAVTQAGDNYAFGELEGVPHFGLHDIAAVKRKRVEHVNRRVALSSGTITNFEFFVLNAAAAALHSIPAQRLGLSGRHQRLRRESVPFGRARGSKHPKAPRHKREPTTGSRLRSHRQLSRD
jgi:hypothetical protein